MRKPFYDYFDRFDCDPADCSDSKYDVTTEIATDNSDEITETRENELDFDNDYDTEIATDFDEEMPSPDDELAATRDCDPTIWAQQKCSLDDYEIISDVLGSEKQLVKLYSTALCESAEEPLRDVIRDNLIECAADQYSTFEYMQKRGMYPTEQAPVEKIEQAKQQFTPLCPDVDD